MGANDDGDGHFVRFNLRFRGQFYDRETGQNESHHRTYSPRLGRSLQSDPMASSTLFESSYAYVRNYTLKNHPEKLVITLPDGTKVSGTLGLPKVLALIGKLGALADILTIEQLVQMVREAACAQGDSTACTPEVIESICEQIFKCGGEMPVFCPI